MTQLAGSTHSFSELPLDEAIEELLALGLEHIEISHRPGVEQETWERVDSMLGSRQAAVVSVALEESASGAEIEDAMERARLLGAGFVVMGPPPRSAGATDASQKAWEEEANAAVRVLLELTGGATESGVSPALEIPRRNSLTDDLVSFRAFSSLLVRHRIPLSVDTHEVAQVSLSVNELWRYFASRIAHVRLGSPVDDVRQMASDDGERRVDLDQWARMAFAYGYPGVWVLKPDLTSIPLEQRRAALADYRTAAEAVLEKYAQPAAAK